MRCDLHVHTTHSGMCTVPVLNRVCRECYSDPAAVLDTLRRRGMDLFTFTDHDSIDAAEPFRHRPDFFLSEEVTCRTPDGGELHVGVYDIQERHHTELQRRREDLPRFVAYLREQRLFASVNHVLSSITGHRTAAEFLLFEQWFPGLETRNGAVQEACNRAAAALASAWGKAPVGGSDAHTLTGLGLTWTSVPGARSKADFLAGLRHRRGEVGGQSGDFFTLTAAVLGIGRSMMRTTPWTWAIAPLAPFAPFITLSCVLRDRAFAAHWSRRLRLEAMPGPANLVMERAA